MTSAPNEPLVTPSPQGAGGQPGGGPAAAVPAAHKHGSEIAWRWFGWIIAIAGCVFWARHPLVEATMPAEDGTVLFQRHYQEISVAAVFGTWAGYVSLVPNLLACLECRLPALYVPYAFTLTELVLLIVAVTRFLDRRFDTVAPTATRAAVVAALAWVPFGDRVISTSLMYSQVPVLLWLAFILLRPAGGGRRILDGVLVTLFTWTHPMSVALAPISLWRLRDTTMRPVAIVHLIASATYYVFGRDGGEQPILGQLANVPAWVAMRVPFETVFGTKTRILLQDAGLGWLAVAVGVCMIGVLAIGVRCAWPRWSSATRMFVLGLLWMATASAIGALLLRSHLASDEFATRYPWPGRVALLATVVLVIATFVRVWWALALIAVWVPWVAQFDWRYHEMGRPPALDAFLQRVTEQERLLGNRRALDVRHDRPEQGEWFSIVLKPL